YLDFIKKGNTFYLFMQNPKGMFDIETEPTDYFPIENESVKLTNQKNDTKFEALIHSPFRLIAEQGDEILIKDDVGIISLNRKIGEGNLIVTTASEWMMNQNLLKFDHIPLIVSLFNEESRQVLYFEEYIHHRKNTTTYLGIYPMWFLVLMLQATLLTIIWLWSTGKRFGPIFKLREETVRFSDEGIRALTAWYLRGKRYRDSILIQADYVKYSLQEK